MMSFSLSGGVEVYGFIAPTEITDEYPVIDPLYGIDGFRNVDTLNDLNNIPTLRRRAGMVVGIGGGTQYYKLNPGPWNGTITDWTIFNSGGGGGTFTGGTVTGPTIFTNGLTANTLTVNGVSITGDTYTTGGTYSNGTIDFYYNTGGGYQVTGITDNNIYTTGFTYSANTFYITDTSGNTFLATIDIMTGLTINGNLSVTGTTSLQGFSATTISATTIGSSGDCVDDIYVSNIHSCSPLNINPLDEGNVYFGSTSGVTIDLTNNRVGIGTSLPQETLHISGTSRFDNDVTIWDDGVFNGNSRKLYFRGLGQTGNTQTGQIFLDAYGNTNGEILELRSGGGVRLGATDIDGTIQVYNFASNNPVIQSVQSGGLGFNVNSTTNGFNFFQGYNQTSGDLFKIWNDGLGAIPYKAFSILASNGNVGIGNITPQYKLDVSGETRSRDRIYAGVFTPGTMLQPTDYFATTGRIVAGGGINFRSPINNDNTWTGFGFGGFDTAGISIKVRNGEIGSFGGYGGDVNPYLYFGGFFNPISGSTSKNFIQLNPTYSTPNDLSYTGGIRGFLYDPVLTSISGISFHRAIETTTGDVIFGSTSGNVGIGTTTPNSRLQVNGQTTLVQPQGSDYIVFSSSTLANSGQTMFIRQTASNQFVFGTGGPGIGVFMRVGPTNLVDFSNQSIQTNGSATFGTIRPLQPNILNLNEIPSGITAGTQDYRGVLVNPTVNFGGTYSGNFIGYLHNPTITSMANGRHIAMQIVSGDVLLNTTSGNVGIGTTTTPSEKLDVSGKTKTISLQVTSGATSGYVLTSDASGNATWQTPTVTADAYTTGFTYADNTFTISDSSGNTLNATINSVTGLTVNGNLTVTGNTLLQSISGTSLDISGNSSSDLVTITQTGSGNAFVVEDSSRPDSTPFIINSNGNTSIGSSTYLTSVGGIPATLQISNGSAGAITLPIISTPLAIQSNSSTTVSIFSPNAGLSQLTFGSPSDSYASIFRYTPSITQLLLSTTTSGGVIDFQSGTGAFAMRINNNQNIGIGTTSPQARLDVRAQGPLSTDIAFRVRNSGDTQDLFSIRGNKDIYLPSTGGGTNVVRIYANADDAFGPNTLLTYGRKGSGNIAINESSTFAVGGFQQTAIGIGAAVSADGGVSLGDTATVDSGATNGIAIGKFSRGFGSNFIAIGTGPAINQTYGGNNTIVLGNRIGGFGININNVFFTYFASNNVTTITRDNGSFGLLGQQVEVRDSTQLTNNMGNGGNTLVIRNHTSIPSLNITDSFQQYSADITAGNAAPHFRTENGAIVKVYQETTGVTSSTLVSNGGTTLTDTDTFDGYTLKQVVKALRNLGVLQ